MSDYTITDLSIPHRVTCPAGGPEDGVPQRLKVQSLPTSWYEYQCYPGGCIVEDPQWENHEGRVATMVCVASDGTESLPKTVTVPELSTTLGLAVVLTATYFIVRLRRQVNGS